MTTQMDVRAINMLLKTRRIGKPVEWHASLDSTNTAARQRQGAEEGLVIGADAQTAGRGRFDRAWESNAGENLLFSVLLRPVFSIQQFPLLNFLASLSVAETVEQYPALHAALRWPNDVYINGKKACGILSESGADTKSIVLGIGVNVNQKAFPAELSRATSLAIESGAALDRGRLLHILLKILDEHYNDAIENGFAHIMEKWRARCDMTGKQVAVQNGDAKIEGIVESIADDGALRLRKESGELVKVYAGDATLHAQNIFSKNSV